MDLCAALRAELKLHRGRVGRAEKALGMRPGSVARLASGRRPLGASQLPGILLALGVDPPAWYRYHSDPPAWRDHLPYPPDLPRPALRLRQALRRSLAPTSNRKSVVIDFESLELLRYESPAMAMRAARGVALSAESLVTAVRGGMALASATRASGRFWLAGVLLRVLEPFAWRVGPAVEADLCRRVGSLLLANGKYPGAMAVLSRARALYLMADDAVEDVATLVDQATVFYETGKLADAERYAKACISLLGANRPRYVGAAHLLLARITSDPCHIAEAERWLGVLRTYDRYALAYTRARTEPAVAEAHLRQASVLARELSPFDAAFVALDLAALMAAQGRAVEAAREVRHTVRLLSPLRYSPAACAALVRLLGRGAGVTLHAIAVTRKQLQSARLRP